ncbi:MAG: glycosyltransferase [Candidatus Micrarchaeota archaeon]|nr:glycosyltransferase [Candidatus Micrarchaeota archaeon]
MDAKAETSEILLTVVIPALNEEQYIGRTLEHLLKQKTKLVFGKDWEIIVADGGSTDKTVEISKSYGARIAHENTHTIAAGRDAGVKISKGKYIVFTDADVIPDEFWLQNMYDNLSSGKYVAVVGKILPLEGTLSEKILTEILNIISIVLNSVGINMAYGNNMGVVREYYDKIGGFNIHLVTSEDTNLIKRLSKVGKVKYDSKCKVSVSMRRVRKWGVIKFFFFHFTNFFNEYLFNKPYDKYEPVR